MLVWCRCGVGVGVMCLVPGRRLQARWQEMKLGGVFVKVENGEVYFCKKWTFPQSIISIFCTISVFFYFAFYLFGAAYTPNAPTGLKLGTCGPTYPRLTEPLTLVPTNYN